MGNPEIFDRVFGRPLLDDIASHYTQLAFLLDSSMEKKLLDCTVLLSFIYMRGDRVICRSKSDKLRSCPARTILVLIVSLRCIT